VVQYLRQLSYCNCGLAYSRPNYVLSNEDYSQRGEFNIFETKKIETTVGSTLLLGSVARCRSPQQILLRGSPYPFSNFASGMTVLWKIQHWNGAGIDREAAVRESFPTPATLCLQTGLERTSTSSLLQALDCRSRVSLPYGRFAVDPRTISMLNFSKNGHPRSKIGKRVGGSPKQDLLGG